MENPERHYGADEPAVRPKPLFESTSKELSAILVDLHNPIRSKTPFVPVAEARGLPPDLSPEVAAWLARYAEDRRFEGCWCTAEELLEFDWTGRMMQREAMVESRVAHLFAGRRRGFPYKERPSDLPIRYATWMKDGIEVEWEESYAEIAFDFYSSVLPQLKLHGSPDEVRVVFIFCY